MKGRTLAFLLLAIVVAVVALYALRKVTSPAASTARLEHLTPEMQRLVPPEWETLESRKCDFDGDLEEEGLLLYRYDLAPTKKAEEVGSIMKRGLIGAAIYDSQVASLLVQPATPQPYRPTEIFTYRLLPDFYAGKGQGYIGESKAVPYLFPGTIKNGKCQADELVFLGYSDSSLPTRVSIFRWDSTQNSYLPAHFVGNARVNVNVSDTKNLITQVVTYNRLNDRSLLCEVRTYRRAADAKTISFAEDNAAFSMDFCFDAPGDPAYPEGAVVAYLRGNKPVAEQKDTAMPPGDSFALDGASLPADLTLPIGILSVNHAAAAVSSESGGYQCETRYTGWTGWWCGRETATVITEVGAAGAPRTLTWTTISVVPKDANGDVHWRITEVE